MSRSRSRPCERPQALVRAALAAVTAVLALLLPAPPASATALPAAETGVGAFGPVTAVVVGVHGCITAGQRPVRGPSQLQVAAGSCVAAEAPAPRFAVGSDGVAVDLPAAARAPGISRQQQAGHIMGTPQYANRVKVGKPTSTWLDDIDADQLTLTAWDRGSPIANNPHLRILDFGAPIGRGAYGGYQTQVRVSMRGDGLVHGSPWGPEIP